MENTMGNTGAPPTPQPQPAGNTGVTMQRPFIIALLYLLNLVLGISAIVGVILAYVWRNEPETQEWEKTHYTYLIRTFWISFAVGVAFVMLWFGAVFGSILQAEMTQQGGPNEPPPAMLFVGVLGGMLLLLLNVIWFSIRSVLSLAKAGSAKPMPKPKTWWF